MLLHDILYKFILTIFIILFKFWVFQLNSFSTFNIVLNYCLRRCRMIMILYSCLQKITYFACYASQLPFDLENPSKTFFSTTVHRTDDPLAQCKHKLANNHLVAKELHNIYYIHKMYTLLLTHSSLSPCFEIPSYAALTRSIIHFITIFVQNKSCFYHLWSWEAATRT